MSLYSPRTYLFTVFVMVSGASIACGSDNTKSGGGTSCAPDELYDQLNDECVSRMGGDVGSDAGFDAASDDGGPPGGEDAAQDVDGGLSPECDKDGDGVAAPECGGNDCDDERRERSPDLPEYCDEFDNDCNGQVNDGLVCTFYAHSGTDLFEVDPFQKTATKIGENLPNLLDIDTDPDGTLFGITYDGLYSYEELAESWTKVGEFGTDVGDPNGLAIDSFGTAYATSEDMVFTIDTATGSASLLGDLQGNFYSSGDAVVDAKDSFFMTSKHAMDQDYLVRVDRMTAVGTSVGPIGFDRVFALTSAWGTLYGLTDSGELIEIDPTTGAGTLTHTFQDVRFFGAASTPSR